MYTYTYHIICIYIHISTGVRPFHSLPPSACLRASSKRPNPSHRTVRFLLFSDYAYVLVVVCLRLSIYRTVRFRTSPHAQRCPHISLGSTACLTLLV